jgi:hypothetical protein
MPSQSSQPIASSTALLEYLSVVAPVCVLTYDYRHLPTCPRMPWAGVVVTAELAHKESRMFVFGSFVGVRFVETEWSYVLRHCDGDFWVQRGEHAGWTGGTFLFCHLRVELAARYGFRVHSTTNKTK